MKYTPERTVEDWFALYMLVIDGRRGSGTGPYYNPQSQKHDGLLGKIWDDLAGHPVSRDTRDGLSRKKYPRVRQWLDLWLMDSEDLADAMLVPPEEAPADEKAIAARSRPASMVRGKQHTNKGANMPAKKRRKRVTIELTLDQARILDDALVDIKVSYRNAIRLDEQNPHRTKEEDFMLKSIKEDLVTVEELLHELRLVKDRLGME